ncbi:MAG TPA: hypothetical protein VF883_06420 [Thermoanaerobaculia bacterium]
MNYEPLIERDLEAIPAAAHAFLESHAPEELWVSIARFAVLAYAPSQHAKRAVMACRAAYDVRDELGDRWPELVIECARYAAAARQPWSEPPILEPPAPSSGDVAELRLAMSEGDRLAAERWLSARLHDAEIALRELAHGDALLMLDTATALLPHLGEKGRYALLRMPIWELIATPATTDDDAPLATLIARAVETNGAVDAVTAVFIAAARSAERNAGVPPAEQPASPPPALAPYELARDYAQTLIAHSVARRLPSELAQQLLHAVHYHLEHGDSYADWSFA